MFELSETARRRLEVVGNALAEKRASVIPNAGNSYTDFNNIYLNTSVGDGSDRGQWWVLLTAARDHEYAHLRYTSREAWEAHVEWARAQQEAFEKGEDAFPLTSVAVDVLNIIEDARVERAWALEYPGSAARLSYHNFYYFEKIGPSGSRVADLMNAMISLAKVGEIPEAVKDPEVVSLAESCIPYLERGRRASSTSEAAEQALKILKAIKGFVSANRKNAYAQRAPESSGTLNPHEAPAGEREPLLRKKPQRRSSDSKVEKSEGENLEGENLEDSKEKEEEEFKDRIFERELPRVDKSEYDEEDGFKPPEPKSGCRDGKIEELKKPDDIEDIPYEDLSADGFDKIDDSLDDSDFDEFYTEKEFKRKKKEIFREALNGARVELEKIQFEEAAGFRRQKREEDRNAIKGVHERVVLEEIEPLWHNPELYKSLVFRYRREIADLTREIQQALVCRRSQPERGRRRGHIDDGRLWRVALNETNVFYRKNRDSTKPDIAFYILVDSSGSMIKGKRTENCIAAAVICANALQKNAVPFCCTGFTALYRRDVVQHIKYINFPGTGPLESLGSYMPVGENRDGYSIRIAAQEILKRPEKEKTLLVLSDGAPSHIDSISGYVYRGPACIAVRDTTMAIREAIKKGVRVVGVYFGDLCDLDVFRKMYPWCIHTSPERLPGVLGSLLRRITENIYK